MEFLKNIVPMLDQSIVLESLGDSDQLRRLYDLIRKQKVNTDNEAHLALYGNSGSSLAYKKVKQRLRDKLIETALYNGVSNKNLDEYARLYRKCMHKVLAVKTLMLSNAREAGVDVAEKLIKTTLLSEYTDLTMLLAKELVVYYSAIDYSSYKLRKYETVLAQAQELYGNELLANKYYCELRVAFATSRAPNRERTLSRAIKFSDDLRPLIARRNVSYQLLLLSYQVMTIRYEIAQEYDKLLQICEEAITVFEKRKIKRKATFYHFDVYKIVCFIQFGRNSEAESLAHSYLNQMTTGALNWFVLYLYVLLSRLHSRNYQGAYDVLQEIKGSKVYSKMPPSLRQTWIVYEGYIEFLIAISCIRTEHPTKFRLYKFLNEIPLYTKDKRGLNISILIVHVLILLQQRKFTQIIDRVDALNQYCHRHLRRDETFRSNCFIKMLLQIPKADFNRIRAERYAHPYLEKLRSMPLYITQQSLEVEVIPYEHLWQLTVSLLE